MTVWLIVSYTYYMTGHTYRSDDPTRDLGFLITEISRLLRRQFDHRIESLGLTQAQWRALAHLSREEGINQAGLAERLEIRPMTLVRQLDRLEAAGWVERRRDPADRRATRLYLTPTAGPLLARLRDTGAAIRACALHGFSTAEQTQLIEALTRMKHNLLESETLEVPS